MKNPTLVTPPSPYLVRAGSRYEVRAGNPYEVRTQTTFFNHARYHKNQALLTVQEGNKNYVFKI